MSGNQTIKTDVVIIGSGFSGLCVGIQLKKMNHQDFVILEKASQVGGTWRDNSYPGAACDVPSHLYSFSFEPNPNWSRVFPIQSEIADYMNACADKYELKKHCHFNEEVSLAVFSDQTHRWIVTTQSGLVIDTRVLISGTGGLSRPSIANISGLENFTGKVFHSSRWDHEYDLRNKKVAVIGTGASAIQLVPEITPLVSELNLFQRTPAWIVPKKDRPYKDKERHHFKKYPWLQKLSRLSIYWQLEFRALFFTKLTQYLAKAEPKVKGYIRYQVKNPELEKKLTPNYTLGCKRILLSNNFYPAVSQKKVNLITDGIDQVYETGIQTKNGEKCEVDAIILATGFIVSDGGLPFPIKGMNSVDLEKYWQHGSSAYLGCTVPSFPNLFLMTGPNTGLAHNSMILMIEAQTRYIISAIKDMKRNNVLAYNLRPAELKTFNEEVSNRMAKTVWAKGGCKSWYLNKDGRNETLWPGFTFEFILKTKTFKAKLYDPIYA
jgi:cation diffusion facilitator CzcD-associated flavoprotein CzcO